MPPAHVLTPLVEVAERPATGRAGQDRHLALPHAVAVLDGATDPDEPHGRDGGWYAEHLREALRGVLDRLTPLPEVVAAAVNHVSGTFALVPGRSPSSTVAAVRWSDDTVEVYVLGDSTVAVVLVDGSVDVVVDRRLSRVGGHLRAEYRRALAAGHGYDEAHAQRLRRLVELQRLSRNRPDGYAVAEADPDAARQGIARCLRREDVHAVLLASDGAAATVDTYGFQISWTEVLHETTRHGPASVLDGVVRAEELDPLGQRWPRAKPGDDKTLVVVRFGPR